MPEDIPNLKLRELLNRLAGSGQDTQDVEADLEFMLVDYPSNVAIHNLSGETYSLAERTALANGNLVTLLDTESGGNVGSNVLVSLLVTRVLGDEVKVLAADDDGSVHLGGDDGASKDTATDGDETGEGALLVYKVKMSVMRSSMHVVPCTYSPVLSHHSFRFGVFSYGDIRFRSSTSKFPQVSNSIARTDVAALNGGLRGSETQTNVLVPSSATLARSGGLGLGLRVLEDVRLLLESTLRLDGQLGRPDGEVSDSFVFVFSTSCIRFAVTDILNYPSRAGTVTRWRVVG